MKIIRIIILFIFILLLSYTAISKLLKYDAYILEIQQSPLLKSLPGSIIWVLPGFELFVALMLATRHWRLKGLYLFSIMMILFTTYLITISQFTYYIPCSCGGFLDSLPHAEHIILNICIVLMAILEIYLEKTHRDHIQIINHKNLS